MSVDAAWQLLHEYVSADRSAHGEDPADPSTVQAMQIALNLPKANPPSRTEVLTAAAQAVVALCLDERATGEWCRALTTWYQHLIRKVTRRARNSAWDAVQEVPGVTVGPARAFVPTAVAEVPGILKKLQIRGTELPADNPGPARAGIPLIAVDADLGMTVGKVAAQVGHASMLLAAHQPLEWVQRWAEAGFVLQVREWPTEELRKLSEGETGSVVVRDAGFTEVAPDSLTVVAFANGF